MDWVFENRAHIASLTLAHLGLSLPAILLAFVLSLPVAIAANRVRPLREVIVSGTGLLYAVPSLPLFIVLPVLLGTGVRDRANVIVALVLFGMALMVRSAADAFDSVPAEARLSATAQGYSRWGRFWAVDLPLAAGPLLAGLRVVSVSTISLVTVSAVLGVQSLGSLFTDGFQRGIVPSIVSGVVITALLALVLDLLLSALGRFAMPWLRTGERSPR
ncbi:ABC transporter permease [Brevibacterium album]|uniref:ABC transporter permease n=1 Tax=Brevibacterium album TaxID=417948 RepID=UPI000401E6B2|nr:ABC transporter permease subunit [Brevibacterium album]